MGEYVHILEQLLGLRVIDCLDVVIVHEVLLLSNMMVVLEAVLVEGVLGLLSRDVGDVDWLS